MINEDHPVIQKIYDSELKDSDKLLAFNELANLSAESLHANGTAFNLKADRLGNLFIWHKSELGHKFWVDVYKTLLLKLPLHSIA